jgi:hypothetical protein
MRKESEAVYSRRECPFFATMMKVRLVGTVVAMVFFVYTAALASEPQVILVRGWFGIFSTGLDSMATELRAQGIEAEVIGHLNWSSEVDKILRERSAGRNRPLVLVGHSQGANNVIDMARTMEPHKIEVDLLMSEARTLEKVEP